MSFRIWDKADQKTLSPGGDTYIYLLDYPEVLISSEEWSETIKGIQNTIPEYDVRNNTEVYHRAAYEAILNRYVRVPDPFEDMEEMF